MNCLSAPTMIEGAAGVTVMLVRVASVTVIVKRLSLLLLPDASIAVQLTLVAPRANVAPEGGVQVTVGAGSTRSVADA